VVIITNQSGVGRGLFSADMLAQIHVRMIDYVQQYGGKIQTVLFCPHHPDEGCECRKPLTGLYQELASRLNVNYGGVYSVGDSIRDLLAAKSAGASPVLVKTGNGRKSLKEISNDSQIQLNDILVFDNLASFTDALIKEEI